jgi:hypothetical protein
MVGRSRQTKEAEMNEQTTRMVFATAALAAVAAMLAGPAGAQIPEGTGTKPVAAESNGSQAQSRGDVVVPYLSQGSGVDETQFSGTASRQVADQATAQQGLDVAMKTAIASRSREAGRVEQQQTIPYLSQGVGVDESQFAGASSRKLGGVHGALTLDNHENGSTQPLPHGIQVVLSPSSESQSLGLTGDSPLSRVSAPEPEGLTGDSALTRVPDNAPAPTVSNGDDIDWTSFGAGAGMVALIAAGLVGILLATRRRHTVGMP